MRGLMAITVAVAVLLASAGRASEPVFHVRVIGAPAAAEPEKPVLMFYVGDGSWYCRPCEDGKADLAKNPEELPFRVVVSKVHPSWVTFVPVAVWETWHDGKRRLDGWHGRKELVARYRRSLVPEAAKPPAKATLGSVRPIGWHSHRCPVDGTVWRHDGSGPDHVAAHRCPKCGRLQFDVLQ